MNTFPERPAPRAGLYETAFWKYVNDRQLRLQQCCACHHVWYPAGPVCPRCLSADWRWEVMPTAGKAVAWTTFHRTYFKQMPAPYTVVSAELEAGPLLIADFHGDASVLRLGAPLVLRFDRVSWSGDEHWIYRWEAAA